MLTRRGSSLLATLVVLTAVGAFLIPYYTVTPALIGLSLLAWFGYEWAVFHVRAYAALPRLRLSRRVLQGGRDVPTLWAGVRFEVRVRVANLSRISLPCLVIEDRPAVATRRLAGEPRRFVSLPAGGACELVGMLVAPSAGVVRFEGLRLRMVDLQGFFELTHFLRDPVEYLVLPPLTDDEGRQRATKRFNTLPPPGIHRHRRPGTGSELLDLRDYRPGDPPKMIAWKPSARRDKLITKEFENDVPVRCVLFLDTSEGVRLGPPGNTLLARLVGVTAAVAQASAANRDLVGLTTFDEQQARSLLPARTRQHLITVLRRLAEVASLQPGVAGVPVEVLTKQTYPLAQELYPELMSRRVNPMPLSRLWIPLLDRTGGWVLPAMILLSPVLLLVPGWANAVADFAALLVPKAWPFVVKLAWFVTVFLLCVFPPATFAVIAWLVHGARGWFGERRQRMTRRKQLAALLAWQDGTGPAGVERYLHDDDAYAARVTDFLSRHRHRCPIPLYDGQGLYRYRCAGKAPILAEELLRSVSRARDNELYVVLADLAELGPDLAPVIRAVRVARSRHHQVLVIVPWPTDVPASDPPHDGSRDGEGSGEIPMPSPPRDHRSSRRRETGATAGDHKGAVARFVRSTLARQYTESFRRLRRELAKAGADVMRVDDGDPVRAVLDRLDRLRGLRSRR